MDLISVLNPWHERGVKASVDYGIQCSWRVFEKGAS